MFFVTRFANLCIFIIIMNTTIIVSLLITIQCLRNELFSNHLCLQINNLLRGLVQFLIKNNVKPSIIFIDEIFNEGLVKQVTVDIKIIVCSDHVLEPVCVAWVLNLGLLGLLVSNR